ncbi:MAG: MIP/aquaporin family protein [Eggerthellaceae bacterium]|nr:MIP/aquaporin family protein [Eggerthellaceae bacterium]
MKTLKAITGEFIGTFLMCFCGIGAVAVASLFGAMSGPGEIGLVWGFTIAIAIYVTRHLSYAHFNPAVSVAMIVGGRMKLRELPAYLVGQFAGAFVAGLALWGLFADSVTKWIGDNGVTMMAKSSASSIWCEVFPNNSAAIVSNVTGAFAEGLGVFILVLVIFSLTEKANIGRPSTHLAPLFIGLTITVLIGTIGPLTNAGLNPARDLGPRLVGLMVGFGNLAFSWDVILVYTVGPLVGGALAALVYTKILEPMHIKCANHTDKPCDPSAKHCTHSADEPCDKIASQAFEAENGQI